MSRNGASMTSAPTTTRASTSQRPVRAPVPLAVRRGRAARRGGGIGVRLGVIAVTAITARVLALERGLDPDEHDATSTMTIVSTVAIAAP